MPVDDSLGSIGTAVDGTDTDKIGVSSADVASRSQRAYVALYGVYEISKVLAEPVRLEVTLGRVLSLLSSFLDMRNATIALNDGYRGGSDIVVGAGCCDKDARNSLSELPEQALGRIVVTRMPFVVPDVANDPLFAGSSLAEEAGAGKQVTFVGVPIKDERNVIGTLTMARDFHVGEAKRFTFDEDVRFLTMVGNLVGQTVRLQRLIARDRAMLLDEQRRLEHELGDRGQHRDTDVPAGIVGQSAPILRVIDKVRTVARSHSTVLLRGESGTGKELFARALHEFSRRSDKPFVTLNCAALPESILESELFGHERGSFTGAQTQRKGRFELANHGTLFLDEIGEISPQFQAKLLRVLQIGEFERVGGTSTIKVDVRIVSATNRDLEAAVAAGHFRADLYYRLSVVPILLPPLRERVSDIPLLANSFLDRFNEENDTQKKMTQGALHVLQSCSFPGNVRELENCVRRTATLSPMSVIDEESFACRAEECLSAILWQNQSEVRTPDRLALGARQTSGGAHALAAAVSESEQPMDEPSERDRLIQVLESVGWVQAKAARVLDLTPRQVGYAIRKHRIPIKKF